jgi:hypothetical protein
MTWTEAVSVGSAAISAAAAVGAVYAALAAYKAQFMPEVVVYVRHDELRPTLLQIVIENIGRGVAKDVRFHAARDIPDRAWGLNQTDIKPAEVMKSGPLINGIPLLAPGQRRVLAWGQFAGIKRALGAEPITLRCEYKHGRKKMLDEEFLLEIDSFERTDAVGNEEYRVIKELERMSKSLDHIAKTLKGVEGATIAQSQQQTSPPQEDS